MDGASSRFVQKYFDSGQRYPPGFVIRVFRAFSFIVASFSRVFAVFRPTSTHGTPAQPVPTETLAPTCARCSSQLTRLIQRLALQAAPMK